MLWTPGTLGRALGIEGPLYSIHNWNCRGASMQGPAVHGAIGMNGCAPRILGRALQPGGPLDHCRVTAVYPAGLSEAMAGPLRANVGGLLKLAAHA